MPTDRPVYMARRGPPTGGGDAVNAPDGDSGAVAETVAAPVIGPIDQYTIGYNLPAGRSR